jgi:hypothetical protein
MMDMWWRPAAWQDARLGEGIGAAGLFATGENAINIADGGEGWTFSRLEVDELG